MPANYKITDDHFHQLLEDGYIILHEYISKDELPQLQAEQRKVLKPWNEIKDKPPADGSILIPYPYPNVRMSKPWFEPGLLALGRRFLKTPNVVARVGYMLARNFRLVGEVTHDAIAKATKLSVGFVSAF